MRGPDVLTRGAAATPPPIKLARTRAQGRVPGLSPFSSSGSSRLDPPPLQSKFHRLRHARPCARHCRSSQVGTSHHLRMSTTMFIDHLSNSILGYESQLSALTNQSVKHKSGTLKVSVIPERRNSNAIPSQDFRPQIFIRCRQP